MRGMSGHTALATTQISIWDPKDPLRAGFLRTNFPSRVTDLPKSHNPAQVPAYVLETLQYIRRNGHSPDDFVGGREFQNKEKHLPAKDSQNKRIRYSEWDVHPKVKGQNRGPERLVTGSDHSAYFSRDHYKTFLKID